MRALCLFLFNLLFFACQLSAQDSLIDSIPGKYLSQVSQKSRQFEKRLDKRSSKALDRMLKQEQKLQWKLAKMDSLAAKNMFSRSIDSLGNLKAKLKSKTAKYEKALNGQYFGYLDTLQNSQGFLKEFNKAKDIQGKLGKSMESVKQLQSKLRQAEQIKNYIGERKP